MGGGVGEECCHAARSVSRVVLCVCVCVCVCMYLYNGRQREPGIITVIRLTCLAKQIGMMRNKAADVDEGCPLHFRDLETRVRTQMRALRDNKMFIDPSYTSQRVVTRKIDIIDRNKDL